MNIESLLRELSGVRALRPAAETPTALLGQEPCKSRLVAPFYDVFAYSWIVTHSTSLIHTHENLESTWDIIPTFPQAEP